MEAGSTGTFLWISRMVYTVYRTKNLVNGKFYIGVHKTENPHDSYLGSGRYLKNAVAKYGDDGFEKEILFTYLDAASAFEKEARLVEAFHNDPLCMNLRQGGTGGFDYINRNGLTTGRTVEGKERIRRSKLGVKRPPHVGKAVAKANQKRVGWHHPEERRKRIANANRRAKALNPPKSWNEGLHPYSDESKRLMSEARKAWWVRIRSCARKVA